MNASVYICVCVRMCVFNVHRVTIVRNLMTSKNLVIAIVLDKVSQVRGGFGMPQ